MAEAELPIVAYYEHKRDPDHYVVIDVTIDNLRKFCGKVNASIELQMTERSLSLGVEFSMLKGSGGVNKYLYKIKRLPADIVPDKSSYQVKKDKVIIKLCKKVPGSWVGWLARSGLEHDDEAS